MTLRRDKKKESLTRKMLEHERYLLNLIKPIPHSCRFIHSGGKNHAIVSFDPRLIPSNLFTFPRRKLIYFYRTKRVVFPHTCDKYFFYTIFFLHDKIYILVESEWKKLPTLLSISLRIKNLPIYPQRYPSIFIKNFTYLYNRNIFHRISSIVRWNSITLFIP